MYLSCHMFSWGHTAQNDIYVQELGPQGHGYMPYDGSFSQSDKLELGFIWPEVGGKPP